MYLFRGSILRGLTRPVAIGVSAVTQNWPKLVRVLDLHMLYPPWRVEMSPVIIAAFAILIAIMFLLFVWSVARRNREKVLRRRFGPEYDAALRQYGDPLTARAALAERREHMMGVPIRPLRPEEKELFAHRWHDVEAHFARDPRSAIWEADALVNEIMRTRGYPMESFETCADNLSVDHPGVARNYRTAHEITSRQERSDEDLSRAMTDYHTVLEELLEWQGVR